MTRGEIDAEEGLRVVMREQVPDREQLVGLLEAEAPSEDVGAILDPLLETALARSSGDPETPLAPAIRVFARNKHREGVELTQVLAEFTSLRESLIRLWERDAPGPLSFLRILNQTLDE